MKLITTNATCDYCKCDYKLTLEYPSWYDYIDCWFFMSDWRTSIMLKEMYGLCEKCRSYKDLKEKMEKEKNIKDYLRERDRFLKNVELRNEKT